MQTPEPPLQSQRLRTPAEGPSPDRENGSAPTPTGKTLAEISHNGYGIPTRESLPHLAAQKEGTALKLCKGCAIPSQSLIPESKSGKPHVEPTVPFDPRFPWSNQSKNCWQNYVDYYRYCWNVILGAWKRRERNMNHVLCLRGGLPSCVPSFGYVSLLVVIFIWFRLNVLTKNAKQEYFR